LEHFTALDASFLEAEDSDRHISLAVGAVAVLSGEGVTFVAKIRAASRKG
jgi:diacylglycerol O-acyltransferase